MSARAARTLQAAWLGRGPLARMLWPLALVYGALAALRRLLYRLGWRPAQRLAVPVVVVGNLVAGGAGKTPTVIAVVQHLKDRGWHPGIVSRGHGRHGSGIVVVGPQTPAGVAGDEPLLLSRRTGVPVVVGRDRAAAGQALLDAHPQVDVLVADDGLQHLRLARDAQVLVFDERGAGNGWLLPAGPLREPLPARVPSRSVVLYNAPAPSTPLPGALAHAQLRGAVALADWWRGVLPDIPTLDGLRARPIVAAAGLARPQRFFALLQAHGLSVVPLPLPDHHDFATLPWPADTADVIVTEKDAVKIDAARTGATHVWVAALDLRPDAAFAAALDDLLPPPPPAARDGNPPA